ncbi:MAG: NAD(+) diphosphatase [Verrucomicrobiota bacterium]
MPFVPAILQPPVLSDRPLWFVVQGSGLVVRADGNAVALPDSGDLALWGLDQRQAHYLGRLDEQDCFAIDGGTVQPAAPWAVEGLRALHDRLDEAVFGVAGRAVQIVHFASVHRFCGRCGTATARAVGERCMRCPRCELTVYPRVSPAIIVLVRRGAEALLARSARWGRPPAGFYSTLAGFVEPGESLEQTLRREVREEVGVDVTNIRYFGSQPWPFPHSLMVAFVADHASGDIVVDGDEIEDARWFRADALPPVPPHLSIARQLIDAWVGEVTVAGFVPGIS